MKKRKLSMTGEQKSSFSSEQNRSDCRVPSKTGILLLGHPHRARLGCQTGLTWFLLLKLYTLLSRVDLKDFHLSFSILFSGPSLS